MMRDKVKGPLRIWDFPILNTISERGGRQIVPSTGEIIDGEIRRAIEEQQAKWRRQGWPPGLIKAATDQAVGFAEGIAKLAGGGNPEVEKDVMRNLLVNGKAIEIANTFGEKFYEAMIGSPPPPKKPVP
jgi:hypothetical protein